MLRYISRAFGLALFATLTAQHAAAGVFVSVSFAPPPLPVYTLPLVPGPNYIWVPGYWAYARDDYYWVPGTWVLAPRPGLLWTPGYWGWSDGLYVWHAGYWGPHVGYYGGINYGFGYGGVGYVGGRWDHGAFFYNTAVVTNVNTTVIHNTYVNKTVINNTTVNHVSFNGGQGGVVAKPTQAEMAAVHEQHVPATPLQTQHEHVASSNPAMFAKTNHGAPKIAATSVPGKLKTAAHPMGNPAARNASGAGQSQNPHLHSGPHPDADQMRTAQRGHPPGGHGPHGPHRGPHDKPKEQHG